MSSNDQFKIKKTGNSYILYDAGIIAEPALQWFDCDYHTNSGTQQNNSTLHNELPAVAGLGRARVTYFQYLDMPLVLKHYYRGGMLARLVKDLYLGINLNNSRAFKEWRLLKKMQVLGLPVPDAVAAHVKKSLFYYQADLVTREIKNCKTLADYLTENKLTSGLWLKLGGCIKQFHRHDIYHADLNARNILITVTEDIYLIDFDNSYVRSGSTAWKMANLARLKRSLLKFKKNTSEFYFDEENWGDLIKGYEA